MGINFGIIKDCKRIFVKGKDILHLTFEDNSTLTIQLLKLRFIEEKEFSEIFRQGSLLNNLLITKPEDVINEDKNLGIYKEITPFSFIKENPIKHIKCMSMSVKVTSDPRIEGRYKYYHLFEHSFFLKDFRNEPDLEISYFY